ncbi:DEAD/DEAH box helicase [bacterium]|nr:DEAD/DEAH box helicase [bacterium]
MKSEKMFEELGLSESTLEAIRAMEYTSPSPIQAECIPVVIRGSDIIGQAQTGTGKTAAFSIPLVERARERVDSPQFLVICPTRELVTQVERVIRQLSKGKPYLKSVSVIGGSPYDKQIEQLRRRPQIVVGTPGRILDHIRRNTLKLENCEAVVIDEADEMLDRGFLEDIEMIMDAVGDRRQTVLFSATMPPRIIELTEKYLQNAEHINISPTQVLGTTITQGYYAITEHSKTPLLHLLLKAYTPKLALVFCKTKAKTGEVTAMLQQVGIVAEALHGDITQSQRNEALRRFRSGLVNVLVATDVAARGLDIENVELVVNYDIPGQPEHYVHRIGRTGRAGRQGRSVSFITGREYRRLREIETYTKAPIERLELPSFDEIRTARFEEIIAEAISRSRKKLSPEIDAALLKIQDSGVSLSQLAGALLEVQRDSSVSDLAPVGPIQFDEVPWSGGQRQRRGNFRGQHPRNNSSPGAPYNKNKNYSGGGHGAPRHGNNSGYKRFSGGRKTGS